MAKPIRFKAINPKIKIANTCILCGKIISSNETICSDCRRRMDKGLRIS